MVVPIVMSDSVNGSVSVATSGCMLVNRIPRWPTKGDVGRNWRMKSARVCDVLPGVLIIPFPLSSWRGFIRCQDTVCQQTQTTEVGETRSLGETREHRQMQFGCETFQGKISSNSVFNCSWVKRLRDRSHARVCFLVEEISKPEGIEAARYHNVVVLVVFHLAFVFAIDPHCCIIRMNALHCAENGAHIFG